MNITLIDISVLLVTALFIAILYILAVRKVKFSVRILAGFLLGVALALFFGEKVLLVEPIGKGYVALIKMIVVPLIMVSLISSIAGLKNAESLKTIGLKTIVTLLLTTGVAAVIGIITASILKVGSGMELKIAEGFTPRTIPDFGQVILDMLPSNPIASMASGSVIPVMIFSMFIAIALLIEGNRDPQRVKPFMDLITSMSNILVRITKIILKLTPYGVLSLIAAATAKNGLSTLIPLAAVIAAVYLGNILLMTLVHAPLVAILGKKNPIEFFKGIAPAQVVAFTTQSSYGTLPVTIRSLVDNVGVPKNIATFSASLGASMGMNSCGGLYPAVVAVFAANVMGLELTMTHYIMIVFSTIIGSLGVAGVPGAATISTTVVLSALGFPLEVMAMVLSVDAIIDMGRTLTNVTGASVAAVVVAGTDRSLKAQEQVIEGA